MECDKFMNIKPNIGILNALIRITIGFTLLSWATAKLIKRPWRDSYLLITFMAAMKIAEGIVRYCPLTALFEKCQIENKQKGTNQEEQLFLPYSES
jgi:hypothetical protein